MQPKKWQSAIDQVTEIAKCDSCTLANLEQTLGELAVELEQSKISGLAFIAATAAQSCKTQSIDTAAARDAIIELCERLLVALESSQPFDFSNADSTLKSLLFPENAEAIEPPTGRSSGSTFSSDSDIDIPDTDLEVCLCTEDHVLKEFLNEANEHIQNVELLMLNLENNPQDHESIHGLFRAVHSLKGSAGVVELKSLGAITHLAEGVLVKVREGKISLHGNAFEVILAAVDATAAQISSLTECYRSKKTLECPVPPKLLLKCLDMVRTTGKCSHEDLQLLKFALAKPELEACPKESKPAPISDTLRVDGKRLEQLVNLIGDLVITDSMVQRELRSRESVSANSVASRLRKVVREIQGLSLTLKMMPIGTVFQKMNRIVRDLSVRLNKQVTLQIVGADTEVDKTLLECISDPLVHLIRNSIDHGIEPTTAERIAAGKPANATIRLEAEHRAGSIHLRVSDDGRGLNRERILARAIERGLLDTSKNLTESEIDDLIFEPGFSTANEVNDISGRGVGMDVVRKNVESMRGSISLVSRPGQGLDVNLELPLTLSIIDGTVVRTGERHFIVPTLSVVEQVQIASLEFSGSGDCQLVRFRSRFLAVRRLGDVLGTPHSTSLKHGEVVMILEAGGKHQALIVDEVLGQQSVVIKPLGAVLAGVGYFVGGALLSDGQIGFVLDLNEVFRNNN
ncbi:MAG: chemotaxis protein CheA [Pirellulaceae bacterium]|nr:chemotaxis protein CheA [Pirellulaceae bacterium]